VTQLKSKLQLTDEQVDRLKQAAADELTQLRDANAEEQDGNAAEARERATQRLATIIGENKTNELANLAYDFWARGGAESEPGNGAEMPAIPNSVPTDTRVVVNIPGFRMDLFRDGSLVKSYKIGIGYPQFPLPQGLRKAQTIIFNPSWTPPDSPWVAKMKNVTPGEKIEPGSSLNPLGPIKIPIGMPSLIHGGKSPAKLGQFASHGCVGLTTTQVKDFAKLLAEASDTKLSDSNIAKYLEDKTQTRSVKLGRTVPVELRYETIVVEDGKLHIYKDVYDQGTNTEENLRRVLEANGMRLEDLSPGERTQITDALNAMSAHPKQLSQPSPEEKKTKEKAKPPKKEKVIVLELASLKSKGYPGPVDFDSGTAKSATSSRR
jgi:F0F1-type ATP synthase delta subunit